MLFYQTVEAFTAVINVIITFPDCRAVVNFVKYLPRRFGHNCSSHRHLLMSFFVFCSSVMFDVFHQVVDDKKHLLVTMATAVTAKTSGKKFYRVIRLDSPEK